MDEPAAILDRKQLGARPYRKPAKPKRKATVRRWIVWPLSIALWAGLLYASFALAQSYVSALQLQLTEIGNHAAELGETLTLIQRELDEHKEGLTALQEQFAVVQSELAAVKEELELAGDTMHSSGETREALSQRITELSAQLETLRQSIARLEEAARVY